MQSPKLQDSKTASINAEPAIHLRLFQRPPGPLVRSTGVAPVVPRTLTSSGAKRGFFTRQDLIYNAEHDHCTLPGGRETRRGQPRADQPKKSISAAPEVLIV
jgi:hypothetical protein